MIRCLSAVFYLAKPLMGTSGSLTNSLGKKLIIHKMGAGTGSKETTVLYQFQATKVDLPVSLYCIFYRISGFGKFCKYPVNPERLETAVGPMSSLSTS